MKCLAALVLCLQSFFLFADMLDLRSGDDVCRVDVEHGARIVSWKVRGEEMLWMPSVPQKADGKWRHGGIPVVWPWQCDEYPDGQTNGPLHGVAWSSPFKVESRRKTDRGEELALSLEACGLRADYSISIERERLRFRFRTTNVSTVPRTFAMSIHPYLFLPERNQTVVRGLDGLRYRDTRDGFATNGVWKGEMPLTAWADHEFLRGSDALGAIVTRSAPDGVLPMFSVVSEDADAFFVWNPGERWADMGAALYGELPDDAWRHILSVEPGTTGMKCAKPLQPGESRLLTAEIRRGHSLPEVGSTVSGFRVASVKEVPDVKGRLWRMEYEKNGAELVWLDCRDDNRTFAVAFKTVPSDDTGVAHIMEHSVLNGSRKFPVKEPFAELLKSSLSTYLNAWTSSDCTTYPFATKNGQDYLNLMDVYLDAVFHPLSMENDWSMRQEGWHYEYDGTNLTRNGVVYSEMKGVFGNPSRIAYGELHRLLFPDNTYGKVSGGDPAHIPELTYEKYRAFHRRFYHPSNAHIFLYGSIDLPATLAMLDSYLKDFGRQTVDSAVPRQKATSGARTVPYECAEDGDRTLLCDGWVFGTFADREQNLAMDVLCEYLAGSNEAPLKKALLDAGLCKDMSLGFGGSEQMGLYLDVKNTSEDKASACRKLVRETVARLCGAGLDAVRLGAILDRMEFARRENNTSQRGLHYLGLVQDSWLYGGDPSAGLESASLYAAVRARLGTGWFESLLKRAVLDNPHHAEVTLVPSKTLAEERRKATADELRRIRESMTPEQLERTIRDAKALRARQSKSDSPEDLAKLPHLALKDIPLRGSVPESTVANVGSTDVIRSAAAASGIVYLDLCFSLAGLSDGELADVPFLATVLGELATKRFQPLPLKSELDGKLGDFSVSAHSYVKGPQLVVHVSALETRLEDALALLKEILQDTRYDDAEAIANLRTQRREGLERAARANGGGFADRRARRSLSEWNRVADLFGGVAQLRRMQEPLRCDLGGLAKRIFVRPRLTLCVSGKVGDAYLGRLIDAWPDGAPVTAGAAKSLPPRTSEGYAAAGQVGYQTLAGRLPADVPYAGAQVVAARIVSLEHLWNEVRLKGGAYGGNLTVSAFGDVAYSSWRDPNPARSLGQFRRSAEVLADFVKSGKSFASYQISSVKASEPNFSPREEADFARRQYFSDRTPEDLQRLRREILQTTSEDLLKFAKTLSTLTEDASACVFANEKLLKPCKLEKVEPICKPLFRVGLMTDTHVGKDRKSCGLVKAAWELFKREHVDLVVNLGDIADHHYPTGYAAYRACIDETFPGGVGKPDELYVYAWHDAYDYKGSIDRSVPHYAEAFADTERLLRATNGQFCAREYAGFPFLVVPQMLRTREMREQFERMVEDACAKHPGKPVFVFDHIPPKGTTFNTITWGDQYRREFFGRHPQVVAITGHVHGSMRDENNIWQGEFTVVNCGCLQQWCGELVGTDGAAKNSYGVLVMDLYADKAVFRRFDDVRNPVEYRPDAPWTVPFPFDRATAPYAPARRRACATAPAFAAANVLSVKPDAVPYSAFRLSWPQIPDPNPAYKYKIEVETVAADGTRSPLVRRDVYGEFYLPEGRRAKTLLHDIPAAFFEKGRRYRLVVTPVGFFGHEGKPLVAEVTAPAPVEDVEKVVLDVRDPGGKFPAFTHELGNERTEAKDGWFSKLGRLDLPKEIWEAPKGTRFRCVVDVETEAGEADSFILGFIHPSPLQYQGRVRTPPGAPGKRRYVFEFARWDTERFYSFYTQGGPGRVRLDRIVISRLR